MIPWVVLQFPPQPGKSWSWSPKNIPISMTVTDTWLLEETVRVPAGTFTAWKLQSVSKRGPTTATVYTWYASGVGVVKVVREENGERDREGSSELVRHSIRTGWRPPFARGRSPRTGGSSALPRTRRV